MGKASGISASTLKLIAIVSMSIDHVGAALLGRYLSRNGIMLQSWDQVDWGRQFFDGGITWLGIYLVMRMIGRIAFPIFCFMLVEGVHYTKNRWKYAGRLFVFALLSEVPFDLAFKGRWLETSYQNVMFTLLIALLSIVVYEEIADRWQGNIFLQRIAFFCIALVGMAVADRMRTDYSSMGVLAVLLLYLSREKKGWQLFVGCLAFAWEIVAPLAFVPIAFYHGKKGLGMKYFFYAFYPLHLLLIYGICVWMGLASFPMI